MRLKKISVESAERENDRFICTCYDETLGDNTPDRTVTEDELLQYLQADGQGLIPQYSEWWSHEHDRMEQEESFITLSEWIRSSGELEWTLGQIINQREGRTGFIPAKPLNSADFLPVAGLRELLNQINNAA